MKPEYTLERQKNGQEWQLVESSNDFNTLVKLGQELLAAPLWGETARTCTAVRILAYHADLNPVWVEK